MKSMTPIRANLAVAMAAAVLVIDGLAIGKAQAQVASAPAGNVVGWRGDGTGRYPDATPPTEWYQKPNGESKNILWKAKLPCYSWATPILVGDKVITRSDPYDLICLDKNSGKLLWIRSHPPFIAVTDDEKKANPAWQEIEPLISDLQKVNDEFVKQGWTKELYKQKYDLQKKINDLAAKADKKYELPKDMYVESWAGYTGATPCSDGKFIYICSGDGITACYDLDGNRKWADYKSLAAGWGEHGSACSPALVGDKLLVSALGLFALDKATGKELWQTQLPPGGDCYAIMPFKLAGTDYAFAYGNIIRVSDGKSLFTHHSAGGQGMATINDNMLYHFLGTGMSVFKLQPKGTDYLTATPLIEGEYHVIRLPSESRPGYKMDETMSCFFTASPLYDNGLLYCVANAGRLVVLDAAKTSPKEAVLYSTFPPFDFKNGFGRKTFGMGLCASPALAGKHIYMTDSAGCTIVIEPGRQYKEVAKNNIEYTVPEGWEPKHWMGPHQEQTEASLVFDGKRIYIRGEQFLYCIGEK